MTRTSWGPYHTCESDPGRTIHRAVCCKEANYDHAHVITLVSVFLLSAISINGVSAHHSDLLTVQQLRAGVTKTPSMPQKGFIVIDVRSAEEHATGFIPGTDLNIDFKETQDRHRDIGAQIGDHLVVYCQSGYRSNIAAETLADLGYRHVYNVTDRMNAWLASGFPVESGRR